MELKVVILLTLLLEIKVTSSTQPCPSKSCLFYTDNSRIRRINILTQNVSTLDVSHLDRAAAITNDVRRKLLIWSDIYRGVIVTYNFTSVISREVITRNIGRVVGLAVDWESGLMYWTDFEREEICVATYDGKKRKTLITAGVINPHGIAVDPRNGLMFWTDWGPRSRIQRATLSGHNQKTIIKLQTLAQRWPHGITIDYSANRLFWIDSYDNVIMSSNFNGQSIVKHRTMSQLHVHSLDMSGRKLYFSDSSSDSIRSIDKISGMDGPMYYVASGNAGVTVYDQSRQPQGMKSCVQSQHNCQFLCLLTTNGSHCACPDGQVLTHDGKTCRGIEKFLLLTESSFNKFYRIPVEKGSQAISQRIQPPVFSRPRAIDFDPIEKRIYWSDLTQKAIFRAFINGTHQQRIVGSLQAPKALAVDWAGRNLYWADNTANRIEVSKLDGSQRKSLMYWNLRDLKDISLDLKKGIIYWSSYSLISKPKIEQADMNGEHRKVLVSLLQPSEPTDLVIDGNRLYWLDKHYQFLQYVNRDNPHRRIVVDPNGQNSPINLVAMTSVGGILYLLDKGRQTSRNGAILEIDKSTGSIKKKLVWYLEKPVDICPVDLSITKTNVSQACKHNNCSHLCLLSPTGVKCACPDEMILKNDGKTCYVKEFLMFADAGFPSSRGIYKFPLDDLSSSPTKLPLLSINHPTALDFDPVENYVYWTDTYSHQILRAQLTGRKEAVLINSDLKSPNGLAVDSTGRNLYWTDMSRDVIEVSKLDGSYRKTVVKNLDEPMAILLDGSKGFMYWSSWGRLPKIERANMDGTNRTTIISFKFSRATSPSGIALDHETNLLYWIDQVLAKLQFTNLTENNGKYYDFFSSTKHLFSPFGLAISRDDIYWSESIQDPGIYRVNKWAPDVIHKIHGTSVPCDVHVYHNATFVPASHPCAINNGWCTHLCLVIPGGYQCACPSNPGRTCQTKPLPPTSKPTTQTTTGTATSTTTTTTAKTTATTTTAATTTTTTASPITTTIPPTTTGTTTIKTAETTINPTTLPQIPTTKQSTTKNMPKTKTTSTNTIYSSSPHPPTYISTTSISTFTTSSTSPIKTNPSSLSNTKHTTPFKTQPSTLIYPRTSIKTKTMSTTPESSLCHPNPCYSNSTCLETIHGFKCRCQEGYTSRLCDVHFGKEKIIIAFQMELQDWDKSGFKTVMVNVLNHYCSTNDCDVSNRDRRSLATGSLFSASDVLVIDTPQRISEGIEVEAVVLQPRPKNQPGPRKPMPGSLLCIIINGAKSSLLKHYTITAVNGQKDPKCQEFGRIDKSKGERHQDSADGLSGSLVAVIFLGIVVALLLALILLYFYRKRKQRHQRLEEQLNGQNVTFNNPGFLEDSATMDTPLSSPTYEEFIPHIRNDLSETEHHDQLFWNDIQGAGNPMYHRVVRENVSEPDGVNENQHVPTKEGSKLKVEIKENLKLEKKGIRENDYEDPDGEAGRYVEIPSPRLRRNFSAGRNALSVKPAMPTTRNEPEYATIPESVRQSKRAQRKDVPVIKDNKKANLPAEPEYASIPFITTNEEIKSPPKHNSTKDSFYVNMNDNLNKNLPNRPTIEATYQNEADILAEMPGEESTYVNDEVFREQSFGANNNHPHANRDGSDLRNDQQKKHSYSKQDGIDPEQGSNMTQSKENLENKTKVEHNSGSKTKNSKTPSEQTSLKLHNSEIDQVNVHKVPDTNSTEESFT